MSSGSGSGSSGNSIQPLKKSTIPKRQATPNYDINRLKIHNNGNKTAIVQLIFKWSNL